MDVIELLKTEKEAFISSMKINKKLSLRKKEDYYVGVSKAFDDAFNQYARRTKYKYAVNKKDLIRPTIEILYAYFNHDNIGFCECFSKGCLEVKKILNNDKFGIAQKLLNMSFKYLYCYSDANELESKFEGCHMPLDRYTIKWVRSLGDKELNKQLSKIFNAWSSLSEDIYNKIQNKITESLNEGRSYQVSFKEQEEDKFVILPKNRLLAEFVIWHQEQISELRKIIERAKNDFERLGIKTI